MRHKNLLFGACVACIIALVIIGLLAGMHNRVHRETIPIQGNSEQPIVALTFNDGPNARYTPQVLDILYEQQVPATFFLVGEKFAGNKLVIQEMAASGHEIGNHTFSHPDLTTLNTQQIQREIQRTEKELKKILPDYTIEYVCPPYGKYTEKVENAVGLPLMLGTIDSGDWKNVDSETIYTAVVSGIQDGDIIVFHDDNIETVQALEKIIVELQARGFQFVTLSQYTATTTTKIQSHCRGPRPAYREARQIPLDSNDACTRSRYAGELYCQTHRKQKKPGKPHNMGFRA